MNCPICGELPHPGEPCPPVAPPVEPPPWKAGVYGYPGSGFHAYIERYVPTLEEGDRALFHDYRVCPHTHRHRDTALLCARKMVTNA